MIFSIQNLSIKKKPQYRRRDSQGKVIGFQRDLGEFHRSERDSLLRNYKLSKIVTEVTEDKRFLLCILLLRFDWSKLSFQNLYYGHINNRIISVLIGKTRLYCFNVETVSFQEVFPW